MSKVQKEARRDAHEYARAQMFYGEGAGNRRKLIATTVESKASRQPEYRVAFERALSREDMAEHATKARKERRRKDVTHAVNKNARAAATGQYTGLNMGVFVVGTAAYYAHKTGFDKQVYAKGKEKFEQLRARRAAKKNKKASATKAASNVHKITSI